MGPVEVEHDGHAAVGGDGAVGARQREPAAGALFSSNNGGRFDVGRAAATVDDLAALTHNLRKTNESAQLGPIIRLH